MNGQLVTILSGVALLIVFATVGWNLRRHRPRDDKADERQSGR